MKNTATVTLGETPLTRIGLGTNRLTHTAENVAFVREAVAAGVSLIDTAHVYTGGDSEETIGAALSDLPDGCLIATKGGYEAGSGRAAVLSTQIEQSLRRLRTCVCRGGPGLPAGTTIWVTDTWPAVSSLRSSTLVWGFGTDGRLRIRAMTFGHVPGLVGVHMPTTEVSRA